MINLQKSYSEGVSSGFASRPPTQNIRYQLAKAKVDDLFIKWMSMPQTQKLVQSLMSELKQGKTSQLITQPNAFFTNKMTLSGMSQSTLLNSPNNKQYKQSPSTPPRNDGLLEIKPIKLIQQDDLSQSLSQSQVIVRQAQIQEKQMHEQLVQKNYEQVPQFYFPDKQINQTLVNESNKMINEIYQKQETIDSTQFEQITTIVCGLTKYLNKILINCIDPTNKTGKISKQQFIKYWTTSLLQKDVKQRCFHILKKPNVDYIVFDDFKPLLKVLLDSHPGLDFLQATPEFQDRYAETVIHRIFYYVCRKDNGRISWRDFKLSNLHDIIELLGREDDINKIRQYFSYEHFYVIYCKFWELDGDHDFFISKEDFSRYSSHGLSRKVVDRIFDQVPRKFKTPGKMSYEDFIYFILCEEDKTTMQSIRYWFKVVDLDDNGIIAGQEMEHFYEELRQRMEYLNHEPILFQDFVCQMVDLLHPDKDIHFTLEHFKRQLPVCGVFFNFLTNLNKLVAYENRDPFSVRNDLTDHPDFTDWDRFAYQEYVRLAMEEENQEQGEVFEGDNIWDNEAEEPDK